MRTPISSEAKGRIRLLTAALDCEAAEVIRAAAALPLATLQAAGRRDFGARRALSNTVRRMPIPPVFLTPRCAVWRIFRPVPALPDEPADLPGGGPFVLVEAFLLNAPGRPPMAHEPFGAAFTWHCLGRLLDRSGFRIDPLAAMTQAHDALMQLDVENGRKLFDIEDLTLPGGPEGAFLCNPRRFGPDAAPLAVARTWVAEHQAWPDQRETLAAWARLMTSRDATSSISSTVKE